MNNNHKTTEIQENERKDISITRIKFDPLNVIIKNNDESKESKIGRIFKIWVLPLLGLLISGFTLWFLIQQVDNTKDTAQKELRAYVYAIPDAVFHFGGSPTQGYLDIKNGGKTFARNVTRHVGISLLGKDVPDSFDKLGNLEKIPGNITLGPDAFDNGIHFMEFEKPFTNEEVEEIKSEKKRIYVFGKISYEDIYTNKHETTFCFTYSGKETNPNEPGYLATQARYCEKYNFAD